MWVRKCAFFVTPGLPSFPVHDFTCIQYNSDLICRFERSISQKDMFFCCENSAADISKSHTFKWDPLADEVLEAA